MTQNGFSLRDIEKKKREINEREKFQAGRPVQNESAPLPGVAPPPPSPPPPSPPPPSPKHANFSDLEVEETANLGAFFEIISHRKWVILFVAIAVVGVFIAKNMHSEKLYLAETQLLFKGTKSLSLTGFRSLKTGSSISIDTIAFIGKTSAILKKVKEKMDISFSEEKLKSMIAIEADYDSNILDVSVKTNEALLSKNIANTFAQVFIEYNRALTKQDLKKTTEILERQLRKTSDELKKEERNLKEFQDNSGIVSIDSEIAIKMKKVNSLADRIEQIKTELLVRGIKIELLKNRLGEEATTLLANTRIAKPLHEKLVTLEVTLAEARTTRREKHPEVQAIKANIKAINKLIRDKLEEKVKIETYGRNPFRDQLVRDISGMKIERTSLLAREKTLEELWERESLALKQFPNSKIKYLRIQRKLEGIERIFLDLQRKYEESKITEESVADQLVHLQPAMQSEPLGQANSKVAILGLIIGIVMGTGLAFVLEYIDNTIKTPKDLQKNTGLNVLGHIPDYKKATNIIDWENPKSEIAETYHVILNNLRYATIEHKSKLVMVASAAKSEGKTISVVNLAISSALHGSQILLVDCDMRRSGLSKFFGIRRVHDKEPSMKAGRQTLYKRFLKSKGKRNKAESSPGIISAGLSDYLVGETQLKEVIRETHIPGVSIIPSGTRVPNPSELLSTNRMKELFVELRHYADTIFLDSPAVLPVADTTIISGFIDSVIFIARSRYIQIDAAKSAMDRLSHVNTHVVGAILTFVDAKKTPSYYSDYFDED